MIRSVVGHDPRQFDAALDWPLRDLFMAYLEQLRERERLAYYVDVLVWAALVPHQKRQDKPPAVPQILRG